MYGTVLPGKSLLRMVLTEQQALQVRQVRQVQQALRVQQVRQVRLPGPTLPTTTSPR